MNTNQFTTERINNFTDAIFAIAITLLILDVKVPAADLIEEKGAVSALLQNQTPQIIGLVVSFFVAALFWKAHLTLAKNISSYDSKLIWLNTLLLFFVVIMPFSTAFYSRNFGYDSAFFFYCINVACIGIINFLMISHTIKKENLGDRFSLIDLNWMKQRSLIVPIVFMLSVLISYQSSLLGRLTFVLIFFLQSLGDNMVKRKLAKKAT
ncbi:MAG: TMEM175 family protein [Sediminibacterium sp.]